MAGWVNFDSVISQLEAAGMILDRDVVPNNTWQKWKVAGEDSERRGRSILKEWTSGKGDTFIVGLAGIWHGNAFDKIKIEIPKQIGDRDMDAEDHKAMAAARKAMLKEAEANNKAQAKRAAEWAGMVWAGCQPATDHSYLSRKQIQPHTSRVLGAVDIDRLPHLDQDNAERLKRAGACLVIPMHDTSGNIQGLQFVGDKGKTFWPTGMAMASTFGLLGHFPRSGALLLTEGFATAASLHESTGLPCAYAFSAGNLDKAAKEIRKAAPNLRLLIAADDDYLTQGNPGCAAAAKASAEVPHCDWIKPDFTGPDGGDLRAGKKLTDFNDLAILTGVSLTLANQINGKLDALGWRDGPRASVVAGPLPQGGGDGGNAPMKSMISVDEAVARFWGTYGLGGKTLFDEVERRLVHRDDVMNIIPPRQWDNIKGHPGWRVARDTEIGFDPTEQDAAIRCNLFGGWPSIPKPGKCDALLGLLEYLCSNEANQDEIYQWILRWLAYPLQHRGAKMHTALVIHGPQGTGKSRFFEAYGKIFGPYFRVLGQEALEDKFNADWAEKKLFILADEVLARQDMYHIKNRLKGFITGDTIRVNPKNVAAHTERNHMNIVFLSNERMPLVMEADDRRHLVVWVPPKLGTHYFDEVNAEIEAGGIEALHDYLMNLDLGDFKPWTHPPITNAKADLQDLGKSSEDRFINEWIGLDLQGPRGAVIPVCPCLGTHLYKVYEAWCDSRGERKRPMPTFINMIRKLHGWSAAEARAGWAEDLPIEKPPAQSDESWHRALGARTRKVRKMVIPSHGAQLEATSHVRANLNDDRGAPGRERSECQRLMVTMQIKPDAATMADWVTQGYFAFARAAGFEEEL